eukprot:gene51528-16088_t
MRIGSLTSFTQLRLFAPVKQQPQSLNFSLAMTNVSLDVGMSVKVDFPPPLSRRWAGDLNASVSARGH